MARVPAWTHGDLTIKTSGPLFDGTAPALMAQFMYDLTHEVAVEVAGDVAYLQQRVFKQPTGNYWSNVRTDTLVGVQGTITRTVHDNGVIYGPWLEGTGSRNRTTRFKGYSTWRRGIQVAMGAVPTLSARVMDRTLRAKGLVK